MAELSDAQRERAEARRRRRDRSQPQSSSADGAGHENQDAAEEPHHGMKQAAKVAAASAAVGAAAAAARALTSHQDEEREPDEPVDEIEQAPPEAQDEQPRPEPDEAEPTELEPEQTEPEAREEEQDEEPVDGAAPGDVKQAAERAREQLEALLERQVEEISGLERTHDGWVATLEVLELERVPDTTDVLASYEMELDERLNLRRYQQVRRYHRAEIERAESS